MSSTLSYHNFSWHGDPKWQNASRYTVYAPLVVCFIFTFSILELTLGSIWIVQLGTNLSVPMIIQPLLLPGCSFFNALPSLHLHLLLRNNPPTLALIFSALFTTLYLASALLSLAACAGPATHIPRGLRRSECAQGVVGGPESGVGRGIWDAMLVLQLCSAVAYAVHGGMAGVVRRVWRGRRRRGEVPVVEVEVEERRKERARELWARTYRMGGL